MIAQNRDKSTTKSKESYNNVTNFNDKKTEKVLELLTNKFGKCDNSKTKKWTNIDRNQDKNDKILIELKKGILIVNYKNNQNILKKNILNKLKKLSTEIIE